MDIDKGPLTGLEYSRVLNTISRTHRGKNMELEYLRITEVTDDRVYFEFSLLNVETHHRDRHKSFMRTTQVLDRYTNAPPA